MAITTTNLDGDALELIPNKSSRHTRLAATDDAALTTAATTLPSQTSLTTPPPTSNLQITLTILQPSLINFLCSFTNGLITVGLPPIATALSLPRSLYLWPSSVFGLTAGSCLLLFGSVSDILGAKRIELCGCLLLSLFVLLCGFSQTGIQLVMYRAMQGVAMAMHLPASVAIVAGAVPRGRARNVGFACLGLSQPFGFSVGLVASGVMIERVGWRSGFWLAGAGLGVVVLGMVWGLPKVRAEEGVAGLGEGRSVWWRLGNEVDWVGGLVISGGLAILAYILAVLSADLTSIRAPSTATLLPISVLLLVAFPFWMNYRERQGRPALVPNGFWKNLAFTSTCIMVTLSYGVMNAMELFSSLYFQEVQDSSTLTTSLKLLPNLIMGTVLNLCVGLFVNKFPARWLVTVSSVLCAGAPLLMAVVNPEWNYFYMEFWAQLLAPLSGDVLFTVGLIVVSDVFPEKSQGLAGAVFGE